mmetsp:Transcript_45687/g.67431  ORF Transcript_45687/g.67431 Transcript_45687/m.67431 type:complete len:285 (+) Transcript_45687:74-928(+)|eukprot:CAMPEP_0195516804 /NCGR_PEP_ID=MMETSP0794_2-20130614/8772_1 /TAXON_ID=515487 /ORGANISM="Stephanopyxis turris, Strain CCMP 815" /LENGTH=284 /DNA_ID=CAMNT_0040645489 /DNA_START=79 /DNA_END=933 /DNA_ORIENTATION=+
MQIFKIIVASALLACEVGADFVNEDHPSPAPGGAPRPAPDFIVLRPRPSPENDNGPPSAAPTTTTEAPVYGCLKLSACNYDSSATASDNSCTYATVNEDCDGNCLDSAPADCKGVCGGSSVCCPQTCATSGSSGMSCDEIGEMTSDGSSASTCSSLEDAGCDCSGCGCGIIIDSDGYEVPDGMTASTLTCDKSVKVSQPCTAANTCTADECKAYCTDYDGCNYAGSNTQGGCILYSSCKITRTVAATTTTYHRVPQGEGVVDDGKTCACTWWTCVNDDGLGYCP